MENEKLTYINSRGERLELGVDSVYHCNISKDVEGISGVTSVIYSTNSMGQHGDTYVGQRIEARDIDVVGHINTRDKAQALELRRRMLKIFNPELSATLVYEYGGFKRVIDCRAYGEPKILKKEVLYEFDLQIECLNPFWREEEETKSWTDAASQLGAFTSLENAKSACKAGYTVYDDNGKAVYTVAGQQASAGVPFSVQVDILDLNIRTGAGTNYAKTGETTGKGVFTIVEVKAGQGASVGWGRLKSGAGWISLDYATRLA